MNFYEKHPVLVALGATVTVFVGVMGLAAWDQKAGQSKTGTPAAAAKVTRKMVVAGTFYPADKTALNSQLDKYLAAAGKIDNINPYRIVIAPHAGIDYSGPTAAAAFKQITGGNYTTVIILGPSHHFGFKHAALIADGDWETPMGNVEIDNELAQKIISPGQKIQADATVYAKEHSIELEVLWLKKILPDAKIVPILLSQPTDEVISALAYRIAQNMDDRTLVVVSTDLAHYPDYATANKIDNQSIEDIKAREVSRLKNNTMGVETRACGYEALRVAEKIGQLLQLDPTQLVKYENSGDVTGNKDRVVGYAAMAIGSKEVKLHTPQLSEDAQSEALEIARMTLTDFVVNKKLPGEIRVRNPILAEPLGAFVTIKKDGNLRGCIGEFEPAKPLYKVIQEKTADAASKDVRFKPVTADELPQLTLEISVMTPRARIGDWQQIEPGTDGVVVIQGSHMGTFLPQVATDNQWSREEMLAELCRQKAGLPGDCYQQRVTELYTYQAQVFQ